MSIPITISGTTINFPASGDSPNWSPAIIQFAQLVAAALQFSFGPFDIPPQTYTMIANVNNNVSLPNLTFPPSEVQGAIVNYSVFRSTNSVVATETGQIFINFNSSFPTGQKWEISTSHVGISQTTFSITDVGQVQFSTASIAGTGYTGFLTYQASAILTN